MKMVEECPGIDFDMHSDKIWTQEEMDQNRNRIHNYLLKRFSHIKKKEIPMTAPVDMTYGRDAEDRGEPDRMTSMAFLYRTHRLSHLTFLS